MGILNNKIVLVTKVTHFVGIPTCLSCLEEGATVIAQDPAFSNEAELNSFKQQYPDFDTIDQTDPDTIISEVISKHGRIDCLIPNDGFPAIRASVEKADIKDMRAGLEEMITEPFQLIGAVIPHMKQQGGGRIVIPTSAVPYHGLPNYSMYVIGRGAQHTMIQTLAKELAKYSIAVNGAGANFVESPSYFSPEILENEAVMKKILSQVPLGRLGKPQECADVITFLLSDKAGFVTGHVIPVAGGWA